jgi:predicted RNA polymerase sigma factor
VPPKQRAALVLRFVHGLSVEQVAQALNCSTGTVKSRIARGLADVARGIRPGACLMWDNEQEPRGALKSAVEVRRPRRVPS